MRSMFVVGAIAACFAWGSSGCSDDSSGTRSCTDLCREAQAGSCTAITGDCGAFCGALQGVLGPSGCGGSYDGYIGCLSAGTHACDNTCGSQETSLSTCVGTYCFTHASDTRCTVLTASF